ncbi:MAG: HD domain-containing protein, partial [Lachnospiraceae bacterium]
RLDTHLKIYKMQQELETYNKKLHKVVNTQIQMVAEEQNNIFYALASLLESRYGSGDGHLRMIGANCRKLAMSLQFSPKFDKKITSSFIDTIEVASQLHDIGTFAIRDNILLKEGSLTPEEWEVVKQHSESGAKHLEKIYKYSGNNELVDMAVDIARYHHENWDGTGYPYGLAGDEIPLSARIMAIVDVYDALNRDRCYRKAYSNEESLEIMRNETGKRFDPHMMEIFNKVHKQLRLP